MMKRLFVLLQIFVLATMVLAVPAHPGLLKMTQKDGTVLTVRLVGDEHMSYFVNEANGQKMYRAEDGDLKPLSEQRFQQMKKNASERRALIEKSRAERMATNRAAARKGGPRNAVGDFGGGMFGSKKGLVILVNFQDRAFTKTQQDFDNQFNKVGYTGNSHLGSVHDYFFDQSYQQFDLTFDVVGPVTVSHDMAYYGAKNGSDNDSHAAEMVIEACHLVDDQVNYSDYDWDGDRYVDQVFVVFAGYGEAQSGNPDNIWPHEWELNSAAWYGDGDGQQYLDGVIVDTYACSNELSGSYGSTMDGIGTACHEFSHCLGYPDFYDIDYSGGWGMDSWDVMCGGSYNGPYNRGEVPCGYTSYERWMAGWLEPIVLEDGKTVTDMEPLNDTPEAYIIYNDKNSNEYILLENRNNEKWFKYMPSYYSTKVYGLLAIHVDYNAEAWAWDQPNDDPNHQRMTIIPANKRYNNSYQNHVFGGSSATTALTGTSHASAGGRWWTNCSTGSREFNHEVTDITYNMADRTISFLFDGGDMIDDGTRYTVTFVAGSGTCEQQSWTQTDFREEVVLPAAQGARPDYVFVGWSAKEVGKSNTMPEVMLPGSKMKVKEDVKLYAVYKYLYTPSLDKVYKLTTSVEKDKDYLFVSSNEVGETYAIDLSTVLPESEGMGVAVTVKRQGNEMVIINPTSSAVWSCNYASGSNIRRLTNDGRYLVVSATGMGLADAATNVMWSSTSGLFGMVGASRYYVHPSEAGTYSVSRSAGNQVYAYEMEGARPTTYYANTYDYYILSYMVDSVVYKQYVLEAGSPIVPIEAPEAPEGYVFSGWQDVPELMPANDIEVYGYFEKFEDETAIESRRSSVALCDVYTMQGVLVRKGMSKSALRNLPAGIYVVGGRKVIVQ